MPLTPEPLPNRIQYVLQMNRLQQTRRPPAKINCVHCKFRPIRLATRLPAVVGHSPARRGGPLATSPPDSRRPQQLPMPPNLPANRLHIRRKSRRRHHSRMKIAISTPRLTERHLHVNPNLLHHPKTLAHPRLNPAIGTTLGNGSVSDRVYLELITYIRDRSKLLLFFVHEPQAHKGLSRYRA